MPPICFGTLMKIHQKYAVHLGISILFYRRSKPILGGAKVLDATGNVLNIEYHVTSASLCVCLRTHTNICVGMHIY